jgi:hypothetical protein
MAFPKFPVVQMASTADYAISDALLDLSGRMTAKPRTEVGMVAAVILRGLPDVAAAWESLLRPFSCSLNLAGVFCHGSPQVQFNAGGKTRCELADLLVVVDRKSRTSITRKAALVQAKMAARAGWILLTGPSSRRQLALYQRWPLFKFMDTTSYGTHFFDLSTNTADQSGTFGIIDRHFRASPGAPPVWTQHPAHPTPEQITTEPTLGQFLAELTDGRRSGFGRSCVAGGSDDWSRVVDLLLDVTYKQVFRYAPGFGANAQPRGISRIAFLSSRSQFDQRSKRSVGGGWHPPYDDFQIVDDPPRGVSVLSISLEMDDD